MSDKDDFENRIKVKMSDSVLKEQRLKNFLKEIESNPDIIENLSNDRLDKLIAYYEKITQEKSEKIKKLKAILN